MKNELNQRRVQAERRYSLGYDVEIAIDPDKPIKAEVARAFEEATQLKAVLIENPLVALDASSWSWRIEDDEESVEFLVVFKKVAQE
ncbi:MAG: trypsin [Prochlorococcus sp.]